MVFFFCFRLLCYLCLDAVPLIFFIERFLGCPRPIPFLWIIPKRAIYVSFLMGLRRYSVSTPLHALGISMRLADWGVCISFAKLYNSFSTLRVAEKVCGFYTVLDFCFGANIKHTLKYTSPHVLTHHIQVLVCSICMLGGHQHLPSLFLLSSNCASSQNDDEPNPVL